MFQLLDALSYKAINTWRILLLIIVACITIGSLIAATVALFKRKKRIIMIIVLIVGALLCTFLFGRIHWFVFADNASHKVEPELCAEMEAPSNLLGVHVYYKITRWPFSIQSFYQIDNLPQDSGMHKKLHEVMSDTEVYTYIVAYGLKITAVKYDFEHSHDALFFPWYGLVATPEFEYGDKVPGYVFVYRIPAVAIDNIG